jgi:hypothetical protein
VPTYCPQFSVRFEEPKIGAERQLAAVKVFTTSAGTIAAFAGAKGADENWLKAGWLDKFRRRSLSAGKDTLYCSILPTACQLNIGDPDSCHRIPLDSLCADEQPLKVEHEAHF